MSQALGVSEYLQAAADHLAEARSRRQPGPLVSERFALKGLDDAYQVQAVGMRQALEQGRHLSGAKAGLTSATLRAALKVEEPVYGWLFADTACRSGESIAWERLLQPRAEIELAVVLGQDLPAGEIELDQLLTGIAGVVPALEINDSAFEGWKLTLLDAVADNLSSGLYVLGEQVVPLAQLAGQTLSAELQRNGESVHSAIELSLSDCLATALWLARKRASLGQPLRAGDVLLTGAQAPMLELARGDRLSFRIGGLGEVTCAFI